MQETSSGHPSRKRRHANDKDNTKGVGTRNLLWRVVHHEPPDATGWVPYQLSISYRPIVPTASPNMGYGDLSPSRRTSRYIGERSTKKNRIWGAALES
ncbi:hypothetical protein V1478_016046, partial [Vespula squamosa]